MREGADRGRTVVVVRRERAGVGAERGLIVVVVFRDPRTFRRDTIYTTLQEINGASDQTS